MYTHHKVLAAHSIYFQVLGEQGWVGLLLFLSIWLAVWLKAGKIRRVAKEANDDRSELAVLGAMCQVSLVGYLVGGAFLSLAYFDLPYNIVVMLVVAYRLMQQPASAPEQTPGNRAASRASPRGRQFPRSQESLQSRN